MEENNSKPPKVTSQNTLFWITYSAVSLIVLSSVFLLYSVTSGRSFYQEIVIQGIFLLTLLYAFPVLIFVLLLRHAGQLRLAVEGLGVSFTLAVVCTAFLFHVSGFAVFSDFLAIKFHIGESHTQIQTVQVTHISPFLSYGGVYTPGTITMSGVMSAVVSTSGGSYGNKLWYRIHAYSAGDSYPCDSDTYPVPDKKFETQFSFRCIDFDRYKPDRIKAEIFTTGSSEFVLATKDIPLDYSHVIEDLAPTPTPIPQYYYSVTPTQTPSVSIQPTPFPTSPIYNPALPKAGCIAATKTDACVGGLQAWFFDTSLGVCHQYNQSCSGSRFPTEEECNASCKPE